LAGLIALGMRFDDRATGKASEFCPAARILHIDIDPSEIGKIKQPKLGIVADVAAALAAIVPHVVVDDDGRLEQLVRQLAKLEDVLEIAPRYAGADLFAEITARLRIETLADPSLADPSPADPSPGDPSPGDPSMAGCEVRVFRRTGASPTSA